MGSKFGEWNKPLNLHASKCIPKLAVCSRSCRAQTSPTPRCVVDCQGCKCQERGKDEQPIPKSQWTLRQLLFLSIHPTRDHLHLFCFHTTQKMRVSPVVSSSNRNEMINLNYIHQQIFIVVLWAMLVSSSAALCVSAHSALKWSNVESAKSVEYRRVQGRYFVFDQAPKP